jgi:hypothetical protein
MGPPVDHVRDVRSEVIDAARLAKSSAGSRDQEIPVPVDVALSQVNRQPAAKSELTLGGDFLLRWPAIELDF